MVSLICLSSFNIRRLCLWLDVDLKRLDCCSRKQFLCRNNITWKAWNPREELLNSNYRLTNITFLKREPWSSGYLRRLMFRRLRVQIPAPYGHFSHLFVVKNCIVCLKRQKQMKKGREWPS